jgi:hypothetical protein
MCGEREVASWYEIFTNVGYPQYICWLTDEYCTVLCLAVEDIFLGSATEEYITVIFLDTKEDKDTKKGAKEDKDTEKCTLFFCKYFTISDTKRVLQRSKLTSCTKQRLRGNAN